jgi:hypothetical protein
MAGALPVNGDDGLIGLLVQIDRHRPARMLERSRGSPTPSSARSRPVGRSGASAIKPPDLRAQRRSGTVTSTPVLAPPMHSSAAFQRAPSACDETLRRVDHLVATSLSLQAIDSSGRRA